jgi:glutaredoxin domain-containing cysteine-rich protein 1
VSRYRLAAPSHAEAAAWLIALRACLPEEYAGEQGLEDEDADEGEGAIVGEPADVCGEQPGSEGGAARGGEAPADSRLPASPPAQTEAGASSLGAAGTLAAGPIDQDAVGSFAAVVLEDDDAALRLAREAHAKAKAAREAEAAAADAERGARQEAAAVHAKALELCCQSEPLDEEQEGCLLDLISSLPAAFLVPDSGGMAPVHWLCAASCPSAAVLDELLEGLPAAAACKDARGCLPLHWLAANDSVGAELLLLVLEANEAAAAAADNFGQLPLHWLCMSSFSDPRALALLLDAHPAAATTRDRKGLTPAHVLCASRFVTAALLRSLVDSASSCATAADGRGQTALHVLCTNPTVDAEMLELLVRAHPRGVAIVDREGHVPLHYLTKTKPEEGDLWQVLIKAAEVEAALNPVAAAPSGGPSSSSATMPVMLGGDGAVAGIRGRVQSVLQAGNTLEQRPEDRGLLLFTSSMSAVKATGERCRKAAALLEALLIEFEQRDIFVNVEYASQLRRLHKDSGAEDDGGKGSEGARAKGKARGLPELPQLYANGTLIGGLADLKALDDEGRLASSLHAFRIDHQRGMQRVDEVDRRGCEECGGRRFVVCIECSGSRRGKQVFGKYLKCSYCNENGLVPCATCAAAERRQVTQVDEDGGEVIETVAAPH